MTSLLRHVDSTPEIRESVANFNKSAQSNRARSVNILRQTTYWIFDEGTAYFGPSKFSGFSNMTFPTYDSALHGEWSGDRFDGHTARTAVESVTGLSFAADPSLTHKLVKWGENLFGPGAFDGVDESKWRFLRLPV